MKEVKCDRALKLHDDGVSNDAIAARLGINRRDVWSHIKNGRQRRESVSIQYPPLPEEDLVDCHGYEVNRAVVTKSGRVYVRFSNGIWKDLK